MLKNYFLLDDKLNIYITLSRTLSIVSMSYQTFGRYVDNN